MTYYHEPTDELPGQTRDIARAIESLKEEIEAVNWYNQRVAVTSDEQLKNLLAHNRDEEIEHAAMLIEWLRRNMDGWDHELKTFLFTEGDLTTKEKGGDSEGGDSEGNSGLGVGSLKD